MQLSIIWDWGGKSEFKNLFRIPADFDVLDVSDSISSKYQFNHTRLLSEGGGDFNHKLLIGNEDIFCLETGHIFSCYDMPKASMLNIKPWILQPSEPIEEMVDSFVSAYFDDNTVGLHCRGTDNIHSLRFSPLYLFEEMRDNIISSGGNVFLATDSKKKLDIMVGNHSSKVIHRLRHVSAVRLATRSNFDNLEMIDDYIDLLLLSRCRLIYGSFGSSFSSLACCINGNPESRKLIEEDG